MNSLILSTNFIIINCWNISLAKINYHSRFIHRAKQNFLFLVVDLDLIFVHWGHVHSNVMDQFYCLTIFFLMNISHHQCMDQFYCLTIFIVWQYFIFWIFIRDVRCSLKKILSNNKIDPLHCCEHVLNEQKTNPNHVFAAFHHWYMLFLLMLSLKYIYTFVKINV